MQVERELSPTEVFEIISRRTLVQEVGNRGRHARIIFSLQGEQHHGRRPWNWLGGASENPPIAVIDPALVAGSVEQQPETFLDSRMVALSGAAQGEAGP